MLLFIAAVTTGPVVIAGDVQRLEPGTIVELFELDTTALGGTVLRFHAGTNQIRQNVVWQGNTYTAFPMQATGFDFNGNGQLPRPRMLMSNVTGAMTLLVLTYEDLLGAKVTRRRTLAKYLDEVNFPERRNLLEWTEDMRTTAQAGSTRPWSNFIAADTTATYESGVLNSVGVAGVVKLQAATTANAQRQVSQLQTGVADNTIMCASVDVKAAEVSQVRVYVATKVPTYPAAQFNLLTGTVTSASVDLTAYGITDLGNGWFRCWASADVLTGASPAVMIVQMPTAAYAIGDGLYVTRAQFEEASTPTQYQPVLGATWSQNPTADPNAEFPLDIFYIDRKASETRDVIEFELASSFDVAGIQLPRRQIVQNVCTWRYRGSECGYSGTNYFDANDVAVGSLALDRCGKRLSSCEARFGVNAPLPFGSFPAAGLTR